jgi:hypothetical protein
MKALLGVLFVMSVVLAGSEGPWFPWINCLGLVGMVAFVILCNKYLPNEEDPILSLSLEDGDDVINQLAELFEMGWEMSEQLKFERTMTYWKLGSIAQQTRELNQVSIEMAELEGKFN